jgi:4-aminobutyrate aminotransferase/(S)-3-amino-2-methylpropionate transaminase
VGRARASMIKTGSRDATRSTPVVLRRRYASAAAAAVSHDSGEHSFFPDEPKEPIIQTQIPGPESKKAIDRLSKVFDTRSLNMMADYSRSYGN